MPAPRCRHVGLAGNKNLQKRTNIAAEETKTGSARRAEGSEGEKPQNSDHKLTTNRVAKKNEFMQ